MGSLRERVVFYMFLQGFLNGDLRASTVVSIHLSFFFKIVMGLNQLKRLVAYIYVRYDPLYFKLNFVM